jgi:hypothetical protein
MGEGEGADGWGRAASERGSRVGESGEVLTGGAQWSGGGSDARVGPPGLEERGGAGARELGWDLAQPREGRGFFPFPFLILFLLLFFSTFVTFCFFFSYQNFSK